MAATTTHHKTGFMDLPVEIRLEIYEMLLHVPACGAVARYNNDALAAVHASLLLANRQINAEATSLLYSDNVFLAHPTLLASFPRLRQRYPPVREASVIPRIRRFHVEVRLDCDLPYDRDDVTRSFSGVDELEVEVHQSMYLGAGHKNLHKFEGVRGVKHVQFSGSITGFDEYIEWLKKLMMSEPGTETGEFKANHEGLLNRLNLV